MRLPEESCVPAGAYELGGVPIAFTEKGWLTQEQVDAKLAPQRGNP